ncbi:MAG: phosphodiester glycosidase family protein [Clostridia bacterium]|nr:phosphodiester glycosidase family protein [Clostridia bacterium]
MKKFLIISMITILVLYAQSHAYALTKLYETSSTQVINSGTTLTKYKRLTDKGWLAINMIEANLKDENTTVRVLTSSNGLQTFQNVKTMLTNEENCIAAVNADFFTGNYKKGNIIGMTIKNGKMLTSTYYENEIKNTMASFYIDDNNGAAFDYFTNEITLKNLNNSEVFSISEMNKWSSNYEYPVLYTREWGEKSLGQSLGINLTELVVENGVVKEIREGKEEVDIPTNGFVVCAIGSSAERINNLFRKGNKVQLNIDIGIDVTKVKTAVSGGSFLVKNGEVSDFTHVIYGANPRTALGLSKDCSKVYLVTIDGRQAVSIGVTQVEFAEILSEKGIYNAINLDGGGSTTMVAKELGDTEATIENYPSDGTLRMVANAVGVFNTNKKGTLSNLLIEVNDNNVFVGSEKELIVKGYDEYYHPIEVEKKDIEWSCSGAEAFVKDNVLKAGNEVGTAKVTAKVGKASASIDIDVLSMPNELTIYPKKTTISQNDSVTFKVSGQNKNGYESKLKNSDVEWKVQGFNASVKEGVFSAKEDGNYIVEVSAGKAIAYALVSVSSKQSKMISDFETKNFQFTSYPSDVKGDVQLSSEEVYEGKRSAKLTYDFTKSTETRAAYLRFNDTIVLENGAENLKVMFYATNSTSDQIKVKLKDANGDTQYLSLLKGLESKGWQELKLNLKNVALPANLIDLYVVQDNEDALTSGSVYFDKLVVEYKNEVPESNVEIPKDVKGEDALNTYSELENGNAFRVVVSPEFYSGILLEQLKNRKMENIINKNSEIVIYPYKNHEDMLVNIEKEKVIENQYSISNRGSLTIINLNIAEGGLRASDSNQWLSLQNDIQVANKNVLLVLNGNIEDFRDDMEKELFINVIADLRKSTSKNIWVIQKGDNIDYSMKRGVRYLTISSNEFDHVTSEDIRNTNYIIITVNQDKMTYEIKNVFEK